MYGETVGAFVRSKYTGSDPSVYRVEFVKYLLPCWSSMLYVRIRTNAFSQLEILAMDIAVTDRSHPSHVANLNVDHSVGNFCSNAIGCLLWM